MTKPETVSEAIEENAKGPKRVTVGTETVEQHPIQDQIAADDHATRKAAAARKHFGLRFTKLVPPGAG